MFSLGPRTQREWLCLSVFCSVSLVLSCFLEPLTSPVSLSKPPPNLLLLSRSAKPSNSGSAVKHQIPLPAAINTSQVQQTHTRTHTAENAQTQSFSSLRHTSTAVKSHCRLLATAFITIYMYNIRISLIPTLL